jgi:MFS family permease
MFDTKTSCLIRGIIGVIFGFLALILPKETQTLILGSFYLLIILGIALFIFLAVTAKGDESMLWFGLAAVLLVIGVISIIVSGFVAILFILIIAAIAIYNGFTDITLALEHPKTKYILIPGMILTGFVLLGALIYYNRNFGSEDRLFFTIVGMFALVFGLFSIMLGFYRNEDLGSEEDATTTSSTTSKYSERK